MHFVAPPRPIAEPYQSEPASGGAAQQRPPGKTGLAPRTYRVDLQSSVTVPGDSYPVTAWLPPLDLDPPVGSGDAIPRPDVEPRAGQPITVAPEPRRLC